MLEGRQLEAVLGRAVSAFTAALTEIGLNGLGLAASHG